MLYFHGITLLHEDICVNHSHAGAEMDLPPGMKPIHKQFAWHFSCIGFGACLRTESNSRKCLCIGTGVCEYTDYIHTEGGGKGANKKEFFEQNNFSCIRASAKTRHISANINFLKNVSCMCWFCASGYVLSKLPRS